MSTSLANMLAPPKTTWRPRLIELLALADSAYGPEYETTMAELHRLTRSVLAGAGLTVKLGKRYTTLSGRHLRRIEIMRGDELVRQGDAPDGPAAWVRAHVIVANS